MRCRGTEAAALPDGELPGRGEHPVVLAIKNGDEGAVCAALRLASAAEVLPLLPPSGNPKPASHCVLYELEQKLTLSFGDRC